MLNKLNISGTIGVFSFLEVYSFLLRLHIEFDKNANSSYVSVLYTFRISLLSDKSGFAFFVRWLRSAHFLILEVVIVKKIILLQEPSFLWNLYFVFYLKFNFKTLFKESFGDKKRKNSRHSVKILC